MAKYSAGCLTRAEDPHPASLKGFRSDPEVGAMAMNRGAFPAGMTFKLPSPRKVGVFSLGEPEVPSYQAVVAENGPNFARGRRAFNHYCHMQQKAKMLIPSLPVQSRVDECNRVQKHAREWEAYRQSTLDAIEQNEQRRLDRLKLNKSLLQTRSISRDVGRRLQASCSLPEIKNPCGAPGQQTDALKLLNRRVDVNRLKKCRSELIQKQKSKATKLLNEKNMHLEEVMDDMRRFDEKHDPSALIATLVDWKSTSFASWTEEKGMVTSGFARLATCDEQNNEEEGMVASTIKFDFHDDEDDMQFVIS